MKRGKFFLGTAIILVLSFTIVSALDEIKNIDHYIKNPNDFMSLSGDEKREITKTATPEQISQIIERYLYNKYGGNIKTSGFESLLWGEEGIIGTSKTYIDLTKLPEDVKSIKFEGDLENGKFTIELEDGSKIEFDKGYLNEEGNLILTNKDETQKVYKWNKKGELIYENGEFILRDGSELILNSNTYQIYTQGNKGEIKIKFDENGNPEITGRSKVDSETADIFRIEDTDRPYKLFFDKEDHSDYEGDYVQIDKDELLKIGGQDLDVKLKNGFNNIEIEVDADKIKLWNGKRVIEYKEGNVNILRSQSGVVEETTNLYGTYDIKKLKVGDIKDDQYFSTRNGRLSFFDGEDYRVVQGDVEINLGERHRIRIADIEYSVSKEDLAPILEKIKREDYGSDDEYNLAIFNEVRLSNADWEYSIDPGKKNPIFRKIIARMMTKELQGSDLSNKISNGYDSLDNKIADSGSEIINDVLNTRPILTKTFDVVRNKVSEVDTFLNSKGIKDDFISKENAEKARTAFTTTLYEEMLPILPNEISVGEKMKESFDLRSSKVPKSVFASILVLSNNRKAYEDLGRFIESSTVQPGNGITMGVYGGEVGIVKDANGRQFITSPEVLNSAITIAQYVSPKLFRTGRYTLSEIEKSR